MLVQKEYHENECEKALNSKNKAIKLHHIHSAPLIQIYQPVF